jgi:FkbM family methyltransferase
MIKKLVDFISDKNDKYIILDICSGDCLQSIEFYNNFPNSKIFVFECNLNALDLCKKNIEQYSDRITLIEGPVYKYDCMVDICYINDQSYKYIQDKIPMNRIKLLINKDGILFNNMISNLEMFCVYHKNYNFREYNFYYTFFGVNEIYPKEKSKNNVLEYELEKYNPFLQKRGYMETSAYLHVYWNNLYHGKNMIGFSQYDMIHHDKYDNLEKNTIYLFGYEQIVEHQCWHGLMFPGLRNLDFLIKSYNKHFNKNYSLNELENQPLSLCQTNIYPVKIYEKLCSWLEKLVEEIYPWSNQPPYETHFGSIGGYTERALSIYNAFEIYEGVPCKKLNITHLPGTEIKEQYNCGSFLDNYSQDIHCKIIDNANLQEYDIIGSTIKNNSIVRELLNGIAKFHYIDNDGNKSKELMIFGDNKKDEFKWHHNILKDNLSNYEIYYKMIKDNMYNIYIDTFKTYKIIHYITKNNIVIPEKNEYTKELEQRWSSHEPQTNTKIISLIDNLNDCKKQWIFDAGSHVGDTLLMMSMYLSSKNINNIKLIGIEPNKDKIKFINEIIKLNNITNIELYCNAISDEQGTYSINKSCKNSGAWTCYNNNCATDSYVSIDDICDQKNIYLMHLDVEGYEIKALQSGKNTLKSLQHLIIEYEHVGLDNIMKYLTPDQFSCEIISAGDVYFTIYK